MTTVGETGEFGLIDRIKRYLPTGPSVVEGIGDDCAVVRLHGRTYLATCDLALEGVHFRTDYSSGEDIGYKAAVSNLSDIAAMGGNPLFAVVSFACPPETSAAFCEDISKGLSRAMSSYGAVIVGGDTTECPDRIVLDVALIGEAIDGIYQKRNGARAGDVLAVTGHLGLSNTGLHALQHGHEAESLIEAHRRPRPRVNEGKWLGRHTAVRAMIDISDGLVSDAGHLARQAGLGVEIRRDDLLVHPDLKAYATHHDPTEFILRGGEDYELAFVLDGDTAAVAIDHFHQEFRTPVSIIGAFTDEWEGVRVDGEETDLHGYEHFRKADGT